MYKYLALIGFLMLCTFSVMAQSPDTTKTHPALKNSKDTLMSTRNDTIVSKAFKPKAKKEKVYHPDSLHSPHTAWVHSLLIPGWGQVYNHRWWKVPVIYGGLSLLGIAIIYNNTYYNEFLALSKYREHGLQPGPKDPYYTQYQLYSAQPDQALYDATDGYRRDRDLCILGVLGAWGINCIDAYIDAKFENAYTVDNNLSMKVTPTLLNQQMFAQNLNGSFIPGIKITLKF
jgi:hypothetical protein